MSIAIAIGFVFLILFILGGATWGPWAQAAPRIKPAKTTENQPRAQFLKKVADHLRNRKFGQHAGSSF